MERVVSLYNSIPAIIRNFLVRATIIFVVWQSLFVFVLSPNRVPDRQLTDITTYAVQQVLSFFYDDVGVIYSTQTHRRQDIITIEHKKVIAVGDPCNALEIYVLYISFLFCFPGSVKRRLLFVLAGIPYIYVINVIRVVLITYLNIYHKRWVDISHHYIFTIVVYLLVFYLWMLYTKKQPAIES